MAVVFTQLSVVEMTQPRAGCQHNRTDEREEEGRSAVTALFSDLGKEKNFGAALQYKCMERSALPS